MSSRSTTDRAAARTLRRRGLQLEEVSFLHASDHVEGGGLVNPERFPI